MKSSSLALAQKWGIKSPREYRDKLIHEFYIEGTLYPEEARATDCWFVQITSQKLKERIVNGEFLFQGDQYSVVWVNSPTTVYKGTKALLSFRWSKVLNRGYVLIKRLDKPMEVREI